MILEVFFTSFCGCFSFFVFGGFSWILWFSVFPVINFLFLLVFNFAVFWVFLYFFGIEISARV